ncbi:hypothetical protein COY26_00965 [Candidatus Woesearchaeota archaeon CG_4_10_14_0_2_um_filter_33_10]|nr:MAG: hypothetical protein COY26_00965 [Candidatus Woesearchaeota archaeon CG_4_10_14_0_2_um_filter_33_10]
MANIKKPQDITKILNKTSQVMGDFTSLLNAAQSMLIMTSSMFAANAAAKEQREEALRQEERVWQEEQAKKTSPYQILGIFETASNEEIKATYKLKAKFYHPDAVNGDTNIFKTIKEAYDIIKKERGIK